MALLIECQPGSRGHTSVLRQITAIIVIITLARLAQTTTALQKAETRYNDTLNRTMLAARDESEIPACERERPCSSGTTTFVADVTVAADHWACAQAGGSTFLATRRISSLIARVSDLFERQTCLKLELLYAPVVCNSQNDPLAYLSGFSRPYDLVNEVRNVMKDQYSHYASHLNIFVTGFDDGSNENGFTYQAAFFQRDFSVIWIRGFDETELAQNVGFLLNASPARRGVMRVKSGATKFTLIRKSRAEIVSFLDNNVGKNGRCLPTVAPIATPTPTSSPKSTYLKTCENAFSPFKSVRCMPSRHIGTFFTHFGKVLVYIAQSFGRASVRASVAKGGEERNNGMRIRSIRVFVWSNNDTRKMKRLFGWQYKLVSEQKYTGAAWLWAKIDIQPKLFVIPNKWKSCCHKPLYLHAQVTVEVPANGDVEQSTGFGVFPYAIGCGNPCVGMPNGQPVQAQFPSQKCYTCIPP